MYCFWMFVFFWSSYDKDYAVLRIVMGCCRECSSKALLRAVHVLVVVVLYNKVSVY